MTLAAKAGMNWLVANANALNQAYLVLGRFYRSPAGHRCRDELLIAHRSGSCEPGLPPDAVFVMMNPGDSQPLSGGDTASFESAVHAPALPDRTQYQVMRLMAHRGWDRVRVINLSDLRTPTSTDLPGLIAAYQRDEGHDGHSIFSQPRRRQLEQALSRKAGAPVVAAWGMARSLQSMAERALKSLPASSLVGLPGSGKPWKYRHPLPRRAAAQSEWVSEMAALLRPRA